MDVETKGGAPDQGYGRSWAAPGEIDTFDQFVEDFHAGRINPDDFKRFRLQHGIYGQRQHEVQMIRVKIPWGGLTASQLDRLADVAERTPRRTGHVTTRQNVQFHFVLLADVPDLMRSLAEVGRTAREACANAVRNVTVGHCAGVCPDEPFDPTPYAAAVARFLLRNPMNQNLPRKFKIAFSGCQEDSGLTPIHDLGARAAIETVDGRQVRGFEILIGGGLGPAPQLAQALEPFTPADDLLPTVAAIVRVFDRHGGDNRNLARLKFVVKKLGIDNVRALILRERAALRLTMAAKFPPIEVWEERRSAPLQPNRSLPLAGDLRSARWRATNVVPQKQPGWASINVRLIRGDVTAGQLRAIARIARDFGEGTVRATNQQNLILRWMPLGALSEIHAILVREDLAESGAERLVDVTSCPGADTCQLGITSSRGLALELGQMIERELGDLADDAGVRIKISGCPNSCGQYHVAGIGLYGGARKFHDEQAPTYQLLLGATLAPGRARFGKPMARVPARQVPEAVKALLELYRAERKPEETFDVFVDRTEPGRLRSVLAPWTELPPSSETPEKYLDWDSDEKFKLETGTGECAA